MQPSSAHLEGFPANQQAEQEALDDELEGLLDNPRPAKASADDLDPDEGFDELEALLGDAMAAKAATDKVKAARAKAKSGYQLAPDDLERIRRWELANEWRTVANTILMHRYTCNCGKHSTVFEAMMVEQVGRYNPGNHRWTAQQPGPDVDESLPCRTVVRKSLVPVCPACLPEYGYSLTGCQEWQA